MDFSHIVQFPAANEHESYDLVKDKIKPEWKSVLINQADKLKKLAQSKTNKPVYVVGGEMGSYPLHQTWDGLYFEDMIEIAEQIDIILITSSANCKHEWDQKCRTLGMKNTIKDYIFIPWCLHFIKKFYTHGFKITKDCTKLFVYLNRRLSSNKIMLRHFLERHNLMQHAHYSWLDEDNFLPFMQDTFKPKWDLMKKVELDNDAGGEMSTLPQPWYDDAYVDVVSETYNDGETVDLSEKTFKPMLRGKPSLQYNAYGHYHTLEKLGFELLHEMFDYDKVEHPDRTKRLEGIADNIKRLSQLSSYDMNKLIDVVTPKLIHNRDLVLNFGYPQVPKEVQYLLDYNLMPVDMYSNWKWREYYFGQKKTIDTTLIKL